MILRHCLDRLVKQHHKEQDNSVLLCAIGCLYLRCLHQNANPKSLVAHLVVRMNYRKRTH